MKKKRAKEVMKEFYKSYQKDPKGWSFWLSPPEKDSFYEAYIIQGDEAFFLKIDSIYTPNPVGIGARLEVEEDQLVKNLPDFGFRKFSKEETEDFLNNIPRMEDYDSKDEFKKDLLEFRKKIVGEAMEKEPVPFGSADSPSLMAIGPYSSKSPLSYISERQEELRRELSRELDRLLKRDHPGYY